jgi:hypothetical protein
MKNVFRVSILILLFVSLIMVRPVLSQIATLLKVRVVDYSGGQVSKNYPDQLTNIQSPLIQNMEINTKGQLTTRLGQALFNVDTATTSTPTVAFGGIGTYYFQNGSTEVPYLIAASAPQVISSLSNSVGWTKINGSNNITSGKTVEFVQANNLLFMIDGSDNTAWWDGSTWTPSAPLNLSGSIQFDIATTAKYGTGGGVLTGSISFSTSNNEEVEVLSIVSTGATPSSITGVGTWTERQSGSSGSNYYSIWTSPFPTAQTTTSLTVNFPSPGATSYVMNASAYYAQGYTNIPTYDNSSISTGLTGTTLVGSYTSQNQYTNAVGVLMGTATASNPTVTAGAGFTLGTTTNNTSASLNVSTELQNTIIVATNTLSSIPFTSNSSFTNGAILTVGFVGTYPGPTSPPTVTTGAFTAGYLFLGGNPANPQYLYVSNNNQPTVFVGNQIVNVSVGDGQPIEKIQPYRTGDEIIYKSRSIYDLNIVSNGNTTCTPQPICTWTLTPLTQDTGTYSPRSVVSLGNDQWFLSGPPYAVRSVIRSQFDKTFVNLISQPIQDIFDGTNVDGQTLNTNEVQLAAAVYYNNKYILAIPIQNSTVNNLVLVYDFISQSWYEITGWYPAEWVVYNNNLYYIDANDGRIVQCFTGNVGDIGTVVPAASMPTVAIDSVYETKIFDFDDPEDPKTVDNILTEFGPTGNYNATLYLNLDGSGWQSAASVGLEGKAITLPVNLPFTLASAGIDYQVNQLTSYGKFWKIQVKLELDTLNDIMDLQKISIYANKLPWERERN